MKKKGEMQMNEYITAQIKNMQTMVKTFEQSCHLAASKNDGKIDKNELKTLKKIEAASKRFISDLDKLK